MYTYPDMQQLSGSSGFFMIFVLSLPPISFSAFTSFWDFRDVVVAVPLDPTEGFSRALANVITVGFLAVVVVGKGADAGGEDVSDGGGGGNDDEAGGDGSDPSCAYEMWLFRITVFCAKKDLTVFVLLFL